MIDEGRGGMMCTIGVGGLRASVCVFVCRLCVGGGVCGAVVY